MGSSQSHGGIFPAEMCRMTLSDLASNLAAGFTLGGASLSYTPPSGFTYIADVCPATCGSHGVGATACGGSGVVTPVSSTVVTTATMAELRTRIANAPATGCNYYWGPDGPISYDENLWTIKCGNPALIFLGPGEFLLGGTQVRGLPEPQPVPSPQLATRPEVLGPDKANTPPSAQLDVNSSTNFEIIGHPGGSTLDAQGLSRIFDLDYKAALTLKNVTLINGRAADGGAIRLRSRFPAGVELAADTIPQVEAARLAIMGGTIRDCEATNDGGAIALLAETTIFGGAAVETPPPRPPPRFGSAIRPRLA